MLSYTSNTRFLVTTTFPHSFLPNEPALPVFEQRTFIKDPATKKNIPIQAIGLSLYESLPDTTEEMIGSQVIRTQWLGPSKTLLGRRALIVDEVDDSRQTLQYVFWSLYT